MNDEITIWEQGFVKDNKFVAYDKGLEENILSMNEGRQVERMIRRIQKKPSQFTHGYYRGVILKIAQQSEKFRGWKLIEIHKFFASLFLKDVITRKMGDTEVIIVTTLSTSETSQKRMNQFIEEVRQWLIIEKISTPEPVKNKINYEKDNKQDKE